MTRAERNFQTAFITCPASDIGGHVNLHSNDPARRAARDHVCDTVQRLIIYWLSLRDLGSNHRRSGRPNRTSILKDQRHPKSCREEMDFEEQHMNEQP